MNTSLTRRTGEIGKLLGAKWKELDEEEKKVATLVEETKEVYRISQVMITIYSLLMSLLVQHFPRSEAETSGRARG